MLLIPHNSPSGQWEKVGIDLFQHKYHDYLPCSRTTSAASIWSGKHSNQLVAHDMGLLKRIFSSIAFQPMHSQTKEGSSHQLNFKNLQEATDLRFFTENLYIHCQMGVLKQWSRLSSRPYTQQTFRGRLTSCSGSLQSYTRMYRGAQPSCDNDLM